MRTEAQKIAIEQAGNTLVMAGAGTGKTTTLVGRVLHWITAGGHSIERLLLVTFTEAAAAEMRHRLRKELTERIRSATDDAADRLHQQVALLEQARISTLHSFCLNLIKEHFHLLGIDPDVRVLDDRQTRPLQERVLDELFKEHYEGRHENSVAVQALIRLNGRGDVRAIRGQVLGIHRFARTLESPGAWLDREALRCASPDPVEWRDWLGLEIVRWRADWLDRLRPLEDRNDFANQACAAVAAIPSDPEAPDAAALFGAIRKPGPRWANGTDKDLKDEVEQCYAEAAELGSLLEKTDGVGGLERDWGDVREGLSALLELVREFDQRYSAAKREMGGVDFSDQEQLALRILADSTNGVAARCREFYQQVMIDEAQDINRAQDAILRAISRNNRFVVGDVKQCIYQFRLSDPKIFQDLARDWQNEGDGRVIPLTDNFRSHEGVIDFVNELFASLMVPSVGGMVYDDSARLAFGAPESRQDLTKSLDPEGFHRVEVDVLATKRPKGEAPINEEDADLLSIEKEARLVAVRLQRLREEKAAVWDADLQGFRPAEWKDMVVLLRSPGPCAESFVREFQRCGVPLLAKRAGFYSALEVRDLLNLLQLLDNPVQDLPLLAVLRSPLVGMSPEELGWIRSKRKKEPVWYSVKRFAEEGGDDRLRLKTSAFLERFADWRSLTRQSSLSHCLEVVLEQTQYESLLAMSDRGAERLGNVRRLLDLARQFDPWQRQGLHRFVKFVEAQIDADLDLEPAPPAAADAVTMMSIHQSKGLEFPIVAVAGLGRQFNEGDLNAGLVIDEEYGLCPQVYPDGPERRYPSLPLTLARRRRRVDLRAEEGRLLYVAVTRARDRLLLVGTVNATADKVRERMAEHLDAAAIASARCGLDWLLPWLGARSSSAMLSGGEGELPVCRWRLLEEMPPSDGAVRIEATCDKEAAPVDLDALADRLEFAYPYAGATIEAAKTSVSELRRRSMEDDGTAVERFRARRRLVTSAPNELELTGAQRGTAHHAFLQRIDLKKAGSPQELRSQANRLVESGSMTEVDLRSVDFDALAEFFVTPLGRKIVAAAGHAARELPFTARLKRGDLAAFGLKSTSLELAEDDFVVVQGVVDLALIQDDSIVILDYKTDSISSDEVPAKAAEYAPQLRLYALAMERINGRRVEAAWLHFIKPRRSVDVLSRL
jgi:ATP-dependent helicase/nuclease subunit A